MAFPAVHSSREGYSDGEEIVNADSDDFGVEEYVAADGQYAGSRFAEVRECLLRNCYYRIWGAPGEAPLPIYDVTLGHALKGIFSRWIFQQAAKRIVDSHADLRWGANERGFRRIVHPNGVCLFGRWKIDARSRGTGYSGYFGAGSEGLVIARYSACCTETLRGQTRSLAMIGKIYPTTDPGHPTPLRPANFITQEDFGGTRTTYINDAELRNAPDTTPWRRGAGLATFLITGLVLVRSDKKPAMRQVYEIAELGKPAGEPTRAPEFMRLVVAPEQPRMEGEKLDFRDEILGQIYDRGDSTPRRTLTFHIEVSDEGEERGKFIQHRTIRNWVRLGSLVFDEAAASYNGDFVLHAHHPPWRNDRNDPHSLARRPRH